MRRRLLQLGTRLRSSHGQRAAKPLILLGLFLLIPSPLCAQPPETRVPLLVEADSLDYRRGERLLTGKGEVFARFQNQTLSADLVEVDLDEVRRFLAGTPVIAEASTPGLPSALTRFTRQMNCQSIAFLPIMQGGNPVALAILGARTQALTSAMLQPYANLC
ncbi:MAG: hypothetical protein ACK4Z6_04775, partial [Candidatus Methylomirabilales bacterium]